MCVTHRIGKRKMCCPCWYDKHIAGIEVIQYGMFSKNHRPTHLFYYLITFGTNIKLQSDKKSFALKMCFKFQAFCSIQ